MPLLSRNLVPIKGVVLAELQLRVFQYKMMIYVLDL
jgi:hypothetical protein